MNSDKHTALSDDTYIADMCAVVCIFAAELKQKWKKRKNNITLTTSTSKK